MKQQMKGLSLHFPSLPVSKTDIQTIKKIFLNKDLFSNHIFFYVFPQDLKHER